jgi:hypothetical protein
MAHVIANKRRFGEALPFVEKRIILAEKAIAPSFSVFTEAMNTAVILQTSAPFDIGRRKIS